MEVNASINGLDLEIAHLHDEITGREMLALVRTLALLYIFLHLMRICALNYIR